MTGAVIVHAEGTTAFNEASLSAGYGENMPTSVASVLQHRITLSYLLFPIATISPSLYAHIYVTLCTWYALTQCVTEFLVGIVARTNTCLS